MMYLFICKTIDGSFDFVFVNAMIQSEAIDELFKKINNGRLSFDLFEKMMLGNAIEERVEIFNALFPHYQIKEMYGGLYKIDIEQEADTD